MIRLGRPLGAAAVALCAAGCWSYNYSSPLGPRYTGAAVPQVLPASRSAADTVRVVTFNIQYAQHVDRAIALIQSTPELRDADVMTLQEMDAPGTRRIAEALHMAYVYYPACVERHTQRDFGDAILSRWPIVADQKIVLPHHARFDGSERIATAATIQIKGSQLRVYSVHLGTQADIGPGSRKDQARAVLADAAGYPTVVISGDMNSHGIGKEFQAAGFHWPTERNPHTDRFWNWDHVFLKGLAARDSAPAGVVRDTLRASDHRPVWVVATFPATASR